MAVEQRTEKKVVCVTACKGLMDHISPSSPGSRFFMNEMSSLINRLRFGTVVAYNLW